MYKSILTASLLPIFLTPSFAQEPVPIPKQNVIDVLNIDLNDDGWTDRVVLYASDEDATVDFFAYNSNDHKMNYMATLAEPIWTGLMAGTQPYLDKNEAGSVQVVSQNASIGRNRWKQIITIAYRNNALRTVGFTYSWYDTLNLEDVGKCDANFLSGQAQIDHGESHAQFHDLEQPALPIQDWTSKMIGKICF